MVEVALQFVCASVAIATGLRVVEVAGRVDAARVELAHVWVGGLYRFEVRCRDYD